MESAWKRLSAWIAEGKLTPQIGHVFPLERAVEAYKLLQDGKNYGKVVIKIASEIGIENRMAERFQVLDFPTTTLSSLCWCVLSPTHSWKTHFAHQEIQRASTG